MTRISRVFAILLIVVFVGACGSSGSSSSNTVNENAAQYAVFGETVSDAIPDGLKVGGASANLAAMTKDLSGECAADYTNCPYLTAEGGADSATGEIFMRIWAMDYNGECTAAYLADGTCFTCTDCPGSNNIKDFIKPTLIADPNSCASTSTTQGRYVNLGVDPCFFDSMIGQISNIAECATTAGGAVDITTAVPWYASWGIPSSVHFSSYYAQSDGGGIWWTVNEGDSGNQQYFLSLDSNWLYGGIKDAANDLFLFFGSGSPAYYENLGEGSGINISAYAGTLSAIPASFEAIQVRDQDETYIERMKSNGSHLWYQSWAGNDFPATPNDVAAVKNNPTENRCVEIGTSIATSKYVPLADCVASFEKASVDELNQDDDFTLKIIDGQTAGSIQFSAPVTSHTTSSCLTETSTSLARP